MSKEIINVERTFHLLSFPFGGNTSSKRCTYTANARSTLTLINAKKILPTSKIKIYFHLFQLFFFQFQFNKRFWTLLDTFGASRKRAFARGVRTPQLYVHLRGVRTPQLPRKMHFPRKSKSGISLLQNYTNGNLNGDSDCMQQVSKCTDTECN